MNCEKNWMNWRVVEFFEGCKIPALGMPRFQPWHAFPERANSALYNSSHNSNHFNQRLAHFVTDSIFFASFRN